jgi:hypothetical protein
MDRLCDVVDEIVGSYAAPPAGSVKLTDEDRRELEAAASDYERGGGRIVYGRQTYLRRAATIRGLLARAGGQTSGQDPLGQSQSAPENTPACDAQVPAKQAVTLTDAEREVLSEARDDFEADGFPGFAVVIDSLLARATKEEGR